MVTTSVTTTETLDLPGIGPVELTVEKRGEGRPTLVLHGGAGPQSVAVFANGWLTGATAACWRRPTRASAARPGPTG